MVRNDGTVEELEAALGALLATRIERRAPALSRGARLIVGAVLVAAAVALIVGA